jgi:hypothetical protein
MEGYARIYKDVKGKLLNGNVIRQVSGSIPLGGFHLNITLH